MGATVQRGATVESFAVVSAGSVVLAGETVPSGQIWAGSPARYLRDLTQEEKHFMNEHMLEMQELSQVYHEETEKTFRERIDWMDSHMRYQYQDPQEKVLEKLAEMGMPSTHEDMELIEQRIYHDYVASVDHDKINPQFQDFDKSWTPYEQDMTHYPEVFKKYQENYKRYEEVKDRFMNEDPLEEQGDDPFKKKLPNDMRPWEMKYNNVLPRYTGTSAQ